MILLLNFNLHSSLKKKKKKKQLLTSSLKTPAVAAVAVTYEDIHISNSLMLWGEELNSELQLAAVTGNGQTRDKCETPLHSSNYWRKYPARSRDLKLSWSESGVRLLLCVEEDRRDNAAINTTHKHGSASSEDDEDDGVDVSRGECADCCVLFWKGSVLLLWIGGSAQRRVLFFLHCLIQMCRRRLQFRLISVLFSVLFTRECVFNHASARICAHFSFWRGYTQWRTGVC